jgi:hypothetical protein
MSLNHLLPDRSLPTSSHPRPIQQHEGRKYLRRIYEAFAGESGSVASVEVDVYAVLEAFGVTCPARQHAIKKLLCAGLRSKGGELDDLQGAAAAVSRAIDIQARKGA